MNDYKKPVLAIDARLINTSGIGTVCQNTISFLIDDFEIILLGDITELKEFIWSTSCKIIPFSSNIYSLAEQIAFITKVPECDYFFSPHYNVPLVPIRAKKRIVIIHDVNHIALKNQLGFVKKLYAKFVIQQALRLSDKILTVSNFSKSEIIRFFNIKKKKINVITLGVDKRYFRRTDENSRKPVKAKYDLPEKFLLYVGNVKPHKNLQVLIKAYHLLKVKGLHKDYKLVIVGKKDGFITRDNEISNLITNLGLSEEIIFTGFMNNEDLPVIYSLATLFVFPSLYEGFGLPPIEAMACGCPVLVSDAASLPEVCKDAAVFFNPLDEQGLHNAIVNILNNIGLQKRLQEKGLNLAATYNWPDTAAALKKVIFN